MLRLLAACALVSLWLVLLLAGWAMGGAVWLLLAGGLALVPWRELRVRPAPDDADAPPAAGEGLSGRPRS